MKQLHSIVTPHGKVRHLAFHNDGHPFETLCGLRFNEAHVDEITEPYAITKTRICRNCIRVRAARDFDTRLPAIEDGAMRRGQALAAEGHIREIPARVYRVMGSTDTYTVTVPDDEHLASVCTCMAAKTHPDVMCKHQVAAFMYESWQLMADETGGE